MSDTLLDKAREAFLLTLWEAWASNHRAEPTYITEKIQVAFAARTASALEGQLDSTNVVIFRAVLDQLFVASLLDFVVPSRPSLHVFDCLKEGGPCTRCGQLIVDAVPACPGSRLPPDVPVAPV